MNVYEEIADLYNFDEIREYKPKLHKTNIAIDNEVIKGDIFTTPSGKEVFVFRTIGTMGNHWMLYGITDHEYLLIGRKTKKQIIEESNHI
jgi:hypothetical protein